MSRFVREPEYSEFAFRSCLQGKGSADANSVLGRYVLGTSNSREISLTEEDVLTLVTSAIIPSPFSLYARSEFLAPTPIKLDLPARPADPMYLGAWGQPTQLEIPPEPTIKVKLINLSLFGFPLSPVNRYINEIRHRRAEQLLQEQRQEWTLRFEEAKLKNQIAVLEFERRVQGDPNYRYYLGEMQRWLRMVEDAEAEFQVALARWKVHRDQFEERRNEEEWVLSRLQAAWTAGRPEAVEPCVKFAVANSNRWWPTHISPGVRYDADAKTLLVEYEFPDVEKIEFQRPGARNALRSVSKTDRRKLQEQLVYGLALKVVFDLADITRPCPVDQIALNGYASFVDKATGLERTEIILSLLVKPSEILELRLSHVDQKSAFKKLKGIMTADLAEHSPVIPIMTLDKNDGRIVSARDVLDTLGENDNLAEMDWADFEHLIRELFEKMFVKNGIEVKITRASRDSGVDAIAFDPNPLTGGKFVIQAKRYTRTVDVSAVRDLFGTLQNEGANRGILVTTSKFGPDSHEFALGKPITLIDGPQLLGLLMQHGYKFTIDLEAARRAASSRAR